VYITRRFRSKAGLVFCLVVLSCAASQHCGAALGADAASVDTDIAKMKGQARARAVTGYTVTEITLPSGTVVREYISAGGKVFAVTWSGMTQPDLKQTLGTYFEEYNIAAADEHNDHHNLDIDEDDFVLIVGGHMRAWSGRAYVPTLLPPNFPLAELQ